MARTGQGRRAAAPLDAGAAVRSVIESIPVEVRRSRRRRTRLGLAFDPAGHVIVEAPMDVSAAEIRAVIRQHRRWLRHRLDNLPEGAGLTSSLRYAAGELLHYLGQPYELTVMPGPRQDVRLRQRRVDAAQLGLFAEARVRGEICVTVSGAAAARNPARVRAAVMDWYRERAAARFDLELAAWCHGLPWLRGMPEWRHRFMRSQWGSCSRAGRISLNTHLIKTPPRLIEYVVLHELCHLRHYDHSPRFYGLMSRYMPDWQRRRAELDEFLPVLLQD